MKGYAHMLAFHGISRWLVLAFVIWGLYTLYEGYRTQKPFTKKDRLPLSIMVGFLHLQALVGLVLYFVMSPLTQRFMANPAAINFSDEVFYFGIYHILCMLSAVIIAQVGVIKAKKLAPDPAAFKAALVYVTIAFILILIAIPYDRPTFRGFN